MNKDKEKINLKIFINSLLNNIKDKNIKLNILDSIPLKKDYFDILINNNEYKKQALSSIIKNIDKINIQDKKYFFNLLKKNFQNLNLLQQKKLVKKQEFSKFNKNIKKNLTSFDILYEQLKTDKNFNNIIPYLYSNKIIYKDNKKLENYLFKNDVIVNKLELFKFWIINNKFDKKNDKIIENQIYVSKIFEKINTNDFNLIKNYIENNKELFLKNISKKYSYAFITEEENSLIFNNNLKNNSLLIRFGNTKINFNKIVEHLIIFHNYSCLLDKKSDICENYYDFIIRNKDSFIEIFNFIFKSQKNNFICQNEKFVFNEKRFTNYYKDYYEEDETKTNDFINEIKSKIEKNVLESKLINKELKNKKNRFKL